MCHAWTAVGLSRPELNELKTLGLMHDIGKIAVEDEYLNKPDALTQEEFENIKKHPYLKYVSAHKALALYKAGKMLLVDVNSKGYYEGQHILGAINIPHISKVNLKINKDTIIGIYCR